MKSKHFGDYVVEVVMILCMWLAFVSSSAQRIIGTQGMINIPTGDMYPKKTFVGGVNYLGANMVHFDYSLYDYFVGFTPFSFVELTFRETLLRQKNNLPYHSFCEQDRSFTVRLQPVRENAYGYCPGVVFGWNDFYSDMGESFYSSFYGVATRHFPVGALVCGATLGYSRPTFNGDIYDGLFGGMEVRHSKLENLRVMVEWDTKGVNWGAEYTLFSHWNFLVFAREIESVSAGFSYQYTIKY